MKTERINLPDAGRTRVTSMETLALKELARRNQMNLSEQIRWLIRREAESAGIWGELVKAGGENVAA